ncbi:energy-coupling factor transporter transmembrane component T family protein [Streptococcus merionis]|uniref:energy-coupling factor transporter transmembrane component T family protein n=1 Tax=Streptococcus merionis TaxID=400065 RepID=UPI0035128CA4
MASNSKILGYQPGQSFIHEMSGVSKLIFFILVSVSVMATYDTRLILAVALASMVLFHLSGIKWRQVTFVLAFIGIFLVINLVTIYLFSPEYGVGIYESRTLLVQGWGRFTVTAEQLFYLFNVFIKYFCTVPLAILFLMTTHPSQFASSLNQIGLSYKVAYAVSLTLRYVPDLQEEYSMIKKSQEARGLELSQKAKLSQRIKGNLQIILPLIFSSLSRIETISTAMELRRFGQHPKRTWYTQQALSKIDYLAIGLSLLVLIVTLSLFALNGGRFYNPF